MVGSPVTSTSPMVVAPPRSADAHGHILSGIAAGWKECRSFGLITPALEAHPRTVGATPPQRKPARCRHATSSSPVGRYSMRRPHSASLPLNTRWQVRSYLSPGESPARRSASRITFSLDDNAATCASWDGSAGEIQTPRIEALLSLSRHASAATYLTVPRRRAVFLYDSGRDRPSFTSRTWACTRRRSVPEA